MLHNLHGPMQPPKSSRYPHLLKTLDAYHRDSRLAWSIRMLVPSTEAKMPRQHCCREFSHSNDLLSITPPRQGIVARHEWASGRVTKAMMETMRVGPTPRALSRVWVWLMASSWNSPAHRIAWNREYFIRSYGRLYFGC